jgi:mRNA interferase YafQ
MRTIDRTTQFKKDFRREARGQHKAYLDGELGDVIVALANDMGLPARCADHAMTGQWKAHRDCHIRPDLVLVYIKPDAATLKLIRIGSHSELGI